MKRSRTRRIVSLFMVLTGILLVFSGFLQEARGPAVLADTVDVAAKPTKEPDWPCSTWNCQAGDVDVLAAWLGDDQGDPLGACAQGALVDAHVWLTIQNGTGSDRPCPWLIFDLYVPGEDTQHFDKQAAETIPGASGSKVISHYDAVTLTWTCGQLVEVQGLVVSWGTSTKPECPPTKCAQRKTQCHGPETMPVEPPPIYALSIDKIGDPGPVTCKDTIYYTITVTNSGDDTLTNVKVVDTKLGINQNVGELAPDAFVEIKETYAVTEGDLPGPIYNVASATSQETLDPVVADWTVTVTDDDPLLTCPAQINVQCPDDVPAAYGSLTAFELAGGSATDTCGIDETSFKLFSELSDGKTCPETITRIYEIADNSGNKAQCTQLIVVDDTIPPQLTVPGDVTVECDESTHPSNTGWATATDNCDPSPTISYSDSVTGGDCPQEKVIVRTWTATDACGNSTSADQEITVEDTTPPVITCPPDVSVCTVPGETTASVDLGSPTAVSDNCDPDPTVSNDAPAPFPAGDTTVTWTATDACGNTATCIQKVTVKVSPVASFTTATTAGEPLKVQFTDTSSGNIVKWSWDFGDTGTSTDPNPSHTYAEGTYTVILTVTDANGCTDSIEKDVTVSAKMTITIEWPDDPCDGNEICFEGSASVAGQGPVSLSALDGCTFLWDFGDGKTSSGAAPCHLYATPGTYDVTLTVTCYEEIEAIATGSVTVWANPTASFTAVPASGVAPLLVVFTDKTSGGTPPYTYAWDFGDGDTANSQNPTHEYANADTYAVVLMVTDDHGCTDRDTTTVIVTPRPELSIEKTADTSTAKIGDVIDYTITVENTGDLTLTNVRVQDTKLGIDETIASLAPGATAEVSGTYGPVTEDDLPGPIHNVATATSNETPDPVEDEWDVAVVSGPAIRVVKTADKSIALVSEPVKYTYVVTNLGDVTLTDVTVTDDMLGSITLADTTLATGASTSGEATYIVLEADLPGPVPVALVNVATASGTPPVGVPVTDEDDASVLVVPAEAPAALLSIEKTGDVGPLSVGDTINYTIKVTNSGDATLTNVVVNDTKLGIIDLNIGDLDPGDTYEITASYGPLEESDVGYVDNTAIASSDQTDPVQDSWSVWVVETEAEPEPTPTPTPIPCIRSDIDVIVYGKIPVEVDMYVAGDLDHSKQTAVNAFGEQQATFSIWPGEGETYAVSITPRLPGYLDPDEWTFQLIKGSLSMRIPRCVRREVILQLLHAGPSVTPTPAPTLPVEELPVTGVPLPASSFGGRLLKLLGFLLIGSGGLFYWTSRRD